MNPSPQLYEQAIKNAQLSLKNGDASAARNWALQAAKIDPEREDPWLILAAVSSPRASIEYLNRALEINPGSQRARKGMHWAIQRYRELGTVEVTSPTASPFVPITYSKEALVRKRPAMLPWALILLALFIGLMAWTAYPVLSASLGNYSYRPLAFVQSIEKATDTALPTSTDTATPEPTNTSTSTPTATPTETPTATPLPTDTPIPTDTATPLPTDTPEPEPTEPPQPTRGPNGKRDAPSVGANERWIDVDLSQQRVYAYEGDQIVNSFLVSTGTYLTPTVTGKYKIYVKYSAADMSGPGYYLPDVQYVMYFYKGYGLHGTYWHHNFGTPMSHGCVNLRTKDAKWLFNWASVGTKVFVHR